MKLPPPLSWLWKGWMAFSHVLGKVMSFWILSVLWVVGFGIYAIILKLIRLFQKRDTNEASFWIDVPPLAPDHLKRQF